MDSSDDALPFEEASARVGQTLRGKWRLDKLLGVGGMAAVYAATHRNGMRGAVKLLHTTHSRNTSMTRRFLREGYIANKVEHIGSVRVLDDDTAEDGSVFLVMELLEGEALDERAVAHGGRLPPDEVMWIANQLLDALACAHERQIVHRDIKPENLFLTKDGILKILDFGLARIFEDAATLRSATHTGIVMGTPAYMSPEQARGRWSLVDGQSDVWSVGASMFSLLSGVHVHGEEETITELVAATFTKPARSLAKVLPSCPQPLIELIDRALKIDKPDRWASAREMQKALAEAHMAIHGAPLPPLPTIRMDSLPPAKPSIRPSGRPSGSESIFSFTQSPSARPPSGEHAPTVALTPAVAPSIVAHAHTQAPKQQPLALKIGLLFAGAFGVIGAAILFTDLMPGTSRNAASAGSVLAPDHDSATPPVAPPTAPTQLQEPAAPATAPSAAPMSAPPEDAAKGASHPSPWRALSGTASHGHPQKLPAAHPTAPATTTAPQKPALTAPELDRRH